jgi:hypothetical protein
LSKFDNALSSLTKQELKNNKNNVFYQIKFEEIKGLKRNKFENSRD